MTFFGKDLSKYQSNDQVTPDFVILNVEDPYFGSKVAAAYAKGIRWDIYKWCYAGATGPSLISVAKRNVDAVWRLGTRYPQFWLDYEDGGVAPWQITDWYVAGDQAGVQVGLYVYLYLLNQQHLVFTRDGWIAYYPSNGALYQPWFSDTARNLGARIHQWSSLPLDQDVVLDDAWYQPPPPPAPVPQSTHQEGREMALVHDYIGDDWILGVNKDGVLLCTSYDAFGRVTAHQNEHVRTGWDVNVQPNAAVINNNLVVAGMGADGLQRKVTWIPNQGWKD